MGGAATFLFLRQQQQQRAAQPAAAGGGFAGVSSHPALKHGMPVGDRLRLFTNYAASFDTRLRNPRWVLEHVNAGQLQVRGGDRTNSEFTEDRGIERRFRSKLEDYRGSGYDRGHMAPASNHKARSPTSGAWLARVLAAATAAPAGSAHGCWAPSRDVCRVLTCPPCPPMPTLATCRAARRPWTTPSA